MTLSRSLRVLAAALVVAFGVGCGGGATNMMQPEVAHTDVPTQVELDVKTSCAGDVCFTYADDTAK